MASKQNNTRFRYVSLAVLLIVAFAAVLFGILNIQVTFEPKWLLLILNAVFISLISLVIAVIAARSFLYTNALYTLLMGCGLVALGTGSAIAGWFTHYSNTNVAVTVYNISALIAALFYTGSGVSAFIFRSPRSNNVKLSLLVLISAYLASIFVVIGIMVASGNGSIPTFFVQGSGSTALRTIVLSASIIWLILAGVIFIHLYRRSRTSFPYWFAIGLFLIAIGLISVSIISSVGSPLGWVGRAGQYLGHLSFLVAVIFLVNESRTRGLEVSMAMGNWLREPAESYRLLVENAPDAIISLDGDGCILMWNPAAERIFGFSPQEAIGALLSKIVLTSENYGYFRSELRKLASQNDYDSIGKTVELQGRRKNGELFPIRVSFSARQNSSGLVGSVIISDISEKARIEEALSESEKKFRQLFFSMNEGVALHKLVFDYSENAIDYIITDVNPAFEKILGLNREQVLQKPASLVYGTGQPPYLDIYSKVAMTGEPAIFETYFPPLKKHFGISVFSAERGTFATVFSDISERKLAEEKIRELNDSLLRHSADLEVAYKEMESFSYSVSHDLRTPLRSISGFSQAIAEDYGDKLDDTGHEYLQRINQASLKMAQLIDDLLNLSRVARSEMHIEDVNLSEIVRSIIKNLHDTAPQRLAEVVIAPEVSTPGDPHLLRIAMENLLQNAWKFTAHCQPSRIEFGIQRENGQKVYFIRDNGIGFEMEYANKLFLPFQRLHSNKEFPGTGIGLATVDRIIRRHGGRIWASSQLNQGAIFYFTL